MDDNYDSEPQFICPITARPCEGDLSHLCEDYGCARKGGLSPHSEENLMANPTQQITWLQPRCMFLAVLDAMHESRSRQAERKIARCHSGGAGL